MALIVFFDTGSFVENREVQCHFWLWRDSLELPSLFVHWTRTTRTYPDHSIPMLVDVLESHVLCRSHPVGLLAAAFVVLLEILIDAFQMSRDVLAGMEVDPLPGANPAVNILEALGKEGAHGGSSSLALGFGATMDATDSDAGNLASGTTIREVRNRLGIFNHKDFEEFRPNKTMETVEVIGIVGSGESHTTLEDRKGGVVDVSPRDALEGTIDRKGRRDRSILRARRWSGDFRTVLGSRTVDDAIAFFCTVTNEGTSVLWLLEVKRVPGTIRERLDVLSHLEKRWRGETNLVGCRLTFLDR